MTHYYITNTWGQWLWPLHPWQWPLTRSIGKYSDPDTHSLSCYNCHMLKTVQEKLKHMVIKNIIYFRFLSTFTMQFKGGVFKILKNRPFCNTDAYYIKIWNKVSAFKENNKFLLSKIHFFFCAYGNKRIEPSPNLYIPCKFKNSNFFSLVQYEHCVYDGYHCHNRLRTLIKEL